MSYTPTIWKTADVITAQKLNKMENGIHAIWPDYNETNWVDGEIISAERLNKLEDAIAYVNLDYVKTVWKNNDIITASLLNNMETGIEIASVDKTWQEMNWNDIIVATRTGKYTSFNVGDAKDLDLGAEGIIPMQIVGINADDLADGNGKAPLTFIGVKLLYNRLNQFNPVLTPSSAPYDEGTGAIGGWEKSETRTHMKNDVMPCIPANVRGEIKPVTKYSCIYDTDGSKVENFVTTEDIWIPSDHEVNGGVNYESLGPVYSEVFTSNRSTRVKWRYNGTAAAAWWLRSASGVDTFRTVVNHGGIEDKPVNSRYALAIGFCL